jgi:hypothetical protein
MKYAQQCYLINKTVVILYSWQHSKHSYILWGIDPLLDFETNNETIAVAMQQHGKHASKTIELWLETVLCNPLLDSCDGWTTTMDMGMFSTWFVLRSYLEDNWGDPVSCSVS